MHCVAFALHTYTFFFNGPGTTDPYSLEFYLEKENYKNFIKTTDINKNK